MDKETTRVEAFSDGVFAIAITLLVLEFKVPHLSHDALDVRRQLIEALLKLWPSLIAYVLSFGTILIMWINHHGLLRQAHHADNRLLFANGFLLMAVTFVPYPTQVLAEYLDQRAANVAATFYCATFVVASLGYNLLLWSVLANRRQGAPESEKTIVRVKRAYRLGLAAYVVATLVSMVWPYIGVAICFSLWPLWAILRYYARDEMTVR